MNNSKAYAAAIGANFIFGSSYAVVKFLTPQFMHPFALNMSRIFVAVSLFWILNFIQPAKIKLDKKDVPRFLICALTGIVINQIFFIKGLSLTSTIHTSLLSLATPIFITIIAALVLKEKFTLLKAIGLSLGIGGASLLIMMKDHQHTGANILLGDVFVLVNAISYAFYLVLVRPLMQKYSPVQVLRWVFTFGSLGILPFGLPQFITTDWSQFHTTHFIALGYVTVFTTFFAYLFTVYSISTIGPSATGVFTYTQPVFATVIAIVFMNEKLDLIKIVAAVLIFSGVYLANFQKSKIKSQN